MVIDEASARFQLYNNGIDFAKGDEGLHTALQRHLLRTAGQRIADLLLRSQEVSCSGIDVTKMRPCSCCQSRQTCSQTIDGIR